LQVLLDCLHTGDTLAVTLIDHLARSVKDLQDIVREPKARGRPAPRHQAADRHRQRGGQGLIPRPI
jgi:hypothetical protein